MQVINDIEQARAQRRRAAGAVALAPTMGALHDGHRAHLLRCRELADTVFVSIFVNPTQFGPGEDLDRYPQTLEDDLRMCKESGVTHVFAPTAEQMYPPDVIDAAVDVPALTADLEGAARPGHFQGVCRVVAKLLNIIQPDYATFGRKDYQQLRVIQAMVRGLDLPVRIIEVDTVRESDGLAMSSRNRYLGPEQRRKALGLYKALQQAKMMIEQGGEADPVAVEDAMRTIMLAHDFEIDYAAVRHPQTLAKLDCIDPALTGGVVALASGSLDGTHLIDNLPVGTDAE